MTIQGGPTILVTRGFPGIIPSTSHGNVAWSDDGQCLAITKKGVLIIVCLCRFQCLLLKLKLGQTPYLTSSIAPPAHLIDPNLNLEHPIQTLNKAKRRAKALEEGENLSDDDAAGGEGSSGSRKPLRRPNGGEVRFYTTAIEADIMGGRESMYGWSELGGEPLLSSTENRD